MVGAIVSDHNSPASAWRWNGRKLWSRSAFRQRGRRNRGPSATRHRPSKLAASAGDLRPSRNSSRAQTFGSALLPPTNQRYGCGWPAQRAGRLGLAHSAASRTVHPWSGHVPLSDVGTWEARPSGGAAWDVHCMGPRSARVVHQEPGPRWLLMNGVTARAEDVIQAAARPDSFCNPATVPLFVIDTLVTLLPQGEVGTHHRSPLGGRSPGWPAFGVQVAGRIGGFDVTSRAELGAAQSGFKRRGYVAVQRFGNPSRSSPGLRSIP